MKGKKISSVNVNNDAQYYTKKPIPVRASSITEVFWVESLEGNHQGKPGDYIIQGVRGELYICDKQIFEETYERAK